MNLRKEILNIIINGEDKDNNRECVSLLELILEEKKFYDLKKKTCQEFFDFMKKDLNFVTFYFKYNTNNSYDTIINLENANQNRMRREVTLTYNDGIFKILSRGCLTEKEQEVFERNRDFYEKLAKFGVENCYPKQMVNTTSGLFNVSFFNDETILSSNNRKFNLSYMYDMYGLENESAIEIETKNYFIRRLLEKNEYENSIYLLENLRLYNDELPSHLNENKIKRLVR